MKDKLYKWIRWQIALLLNKFSDTCWADLVVWAIYPENHDFHEVFWKRGTAGQCEHLGAEPYCGKCRVVE
jgi:hypothetical protein